MYRPSCKTEERIQVWCSIGINLIKIAFSIVFTCCIFFGWILFRAFKR